jgi:hypothetical protein
MKTIPMRHSIAGFSLTKAVLSVALGLATLFLASGCSMQPIFGPEVIGATTTDTQNKEAEQHYLKSIELYLQGDYAGAESEIDIAWTILNPSGVPTTNPAVTDLLRKVILQRAMYHYQHAYISEQSPGTNEAHVAQDYQICKDMAAQFVTYVGQHSLPELGYTQESDRLYDTVSAEFFVAMAKGALDQATTTTYDHVSTMVEINGYNNSTATLQQQKLYADVQKMAAMNALNVGDYATALSRVNTFLTGCTYVSQPLTGAALTALQNDTVAVLQTKAWAHYNQGLYAQTLQDVADVVTYLSPLTIGGDSVRLGFGFNNYILKTVTYYAQSDWNNVLSNASAAVTHTYATAFKDETSKRGYDLRKNLALAYFDYSQAQMTANEYLANLPSNDGIPYRRNNDPSNSVSGQNLAYATLSLIAQNTWKTKDLAAMQYYVNSLYSGSGNSLFFNIPAGSRIIGSTFNPTVFAQDMSATPWTGN